MVPMSRRSINDMAASIPQILCQKKNHSNSNIKTIPSHYALLPASQPHFQLSESEKKAISLELNSFSFIFSSLLATLLFMHHERGAKQGARDWEVESLSTCYILYL